MENNIKYYHEKGYKMLEILAALAYKNNIIISLSTLKRKLKSLHLKRYNVSSPIYDVIAKIVEEINETGQLLGYPALWNKLKVSHNLKITRKSIEELLRQIDPEGVSQRSAKRFKKRIYRVPGPNHIWHLDGYDKLKPYGFPIHGAIDGYSPHIIWLK